MQTGFTNIRFLYTSTQPAGEPQTYHITQTLKMFLCVLVASIPNHYSNTICTVLETLNMLIRVGPRVRKNGDVCEETCLPVL